MATTSQVMQLSQDSQQLIIGYIKGMQYYHANTYNLADKLEWKDRAYMREVDFSVDKWKAIRAKKSGDINKFQNVVIPVVLPQVESAVTFQSSVFLEGFPMFAAVADPENADAATMMDTIIEAQQIRGGWELEFQKMFRDGFKYNILGALVDWNRERVFSIGSAEQTSSAKLTELAWEGNKIKHLDLYNTFWDTSVPPAQVSSDAEYAGTRQVLSRIALKRWLLSTLGTANHNAAFSSGQMPLMNGDRLGYYMPQLNPEALITPDSISTTNWTGFWTGDGNRLGNAQLMFNGRYLLTTVFARIIPSEFGINKTPAPDVPQTWKFCVVNNEILVLAERLTNAHDKLPIILAQPYDDGLGYQTKSLTDNVMPMQEITTALANSSIQSRRRAISDRGLYNPAMVSAAEINNDSPTAKIPVRPGAFGAGLEAAYRPIPFEDSNFQVNSAEMQGFLGMADTITGMNQARQGQFTKGNRTRTEFSSIMAFGSGRDTTISRSLECSLMTPAKEILKANILQYQAGVRMFNQEQQQVVNVDPLVLRKAMLAFKLSDGILPSEKLISGDTLTVALQTLQSVPQLAQGYNVIPMFSYLMKNQGAKLGPFEKSQQQLAYEQAMLAWQQAIQQAAQTIAQTQHADTQMIQTLMQQIPPQPKPQDYGYDPGKQIQVTSNESVLGQYLKVAQANQSQEGPAVNSTGTTSTQ